MKQEREQHLNDRKKRSETLRKDGQSKKKIRNENMGKKDMKASSLQLWISKQLPCYILLKKSSWPKKNQ